MTEDYTKKKIAYEACVAAGVPIPDALSAYFLHQPPSDDGFEIDLGKIGVEEHAEDAYCMIVDLTKIPEDITRLRILCHT